MVTSWSSVSSSVSNITEPNDATTAALNQARDVTTAALIQARDVTTAVLSLSSNNCSRGVNACIQASDDDDNSNITLDAEKYMQMIYLAIGVFGMIGNAFVAGVLLKFRSLRKSLTNTFIINQSLIDGTASFFIVLSAFVRDIHLVHGSISRQVFCRLWLTNLPVWGVFVSSTYNMVAVTYERYYALVFPLRHQHHFTRRKALYVIAGVWVLGPTYNAAYMIPTSGIANGDCTVYSIWPNVQVQTGVGILTVMLQYFIPLVLVTYAYARIAIVLARAGGTGKKKKKKKKYDTGNNSDSTTSGVNDVREDRMIRARKNVIKTLALVNTCFLFCWSWNQIYYTMYNCGFNADFNSTFYHFTVIMVFFNCCLNPIAYAVKYEQFQTAVVKIFCNKRRPATDNATTMISRVSSDDSIQKAAEEQAKNENVRRNVRLLRRLSSDPMPEHTEVGINESNTTVPDSKQVSNAETKISIIAGNLTYHTKL